MGVQAMRYLEVGRVHRKMWVYYVPEWGQCVCPLQGPHDMKPKNDSTPHV
jgi:hypothetical protein